MRTTSWIVPHRDIVQFGVPILVQPRVQEAEGRLAPTDPCIIEHGNNGCKGGSGAGCATEEGLFAFVDEVKVRGLRGDVGDTLCGSKYLAFRHLGNGRVLARPELNRRLLTLIVQRRMKNLTGCTGPHIFHEVCSSTRVLPRSGNRVEGTDDGTGYRVRRK